MYKHKLVDFVIQVCDHTPFMWPHPTAAYSTAVHGGDWQGDKRDEDFSQCKSSYRCRGVPQECEAINHDLSEYFHKPLSVFSFLTLSVFLFLCSFLLSSLQTLFRCFLPSRSQLSLSHSTIPPPSPPPSPSLPPSTVLSAIYLSS